MSQLWLLRAALVFSNDDDLELLCIDISAAKHADLLFVKTKEDGENDLSVYCEREGIKHHLIRTFGEALPVVQDIVEGRKTIQDVLS